MKKYLITLTLSFILSGCISNSSNPQDNTFMAPLEVLTMRSIYFDEGSHALTHESRLLLEQHARWLQCHPGAHIVLKGHCDYIGEQDNKLSLSRERVESAQNFLKASGAKNQFILKWFGSSLPVDSEATERAHSKNRRVEFVILPGTAGSSTCPDILDHLE